jgi:type I site-specific restriction endonuclease
LAPQPEAQARAEIDRLLMAAGWAVQDAGTANIHGARGVAIREFPLKQGHGFADYLLYVEGSPGVTLGGAGSRPINTPRVSLPVGKLSRAQ